MLAHIRDVGADVALYNHKKVMMSTCSTNENGKSHNAREVDNLSWRQ